MPSSSDAPIMCRKLYDAAIVVDETHACAWHKWGMLERDEGNYLRARDLWMQVGCDLSAG